MSKTKDDFDQGFSLSKEMDRNRRTYRPAKNSEKESCGIKKKKSREVSSRKPCGIFRSANQE